jgi:type II secretory pathway pseudopilin PulG
MNTLKLLYLLGQDNKSCSLFKENRPIFKGGPAEGAKAPTEDKAKEKAEAEQAGEQAIKEFTIETEKGIGSHYLSIHKGLKENVAKKVFPSSAILQEDLTTIINESYLSTTKVLPNFSENVDQGKILKVTFEAPKKGPKGTFFKCKALGEKDAVLYEFEVPVQPESLRKILEKKDAVKAEAIAKRQQEQTRALEAAEKAQSQYAKAKLTERAKTDKVKDSDKLKVTDASTSRDEKDGGKQTLLVKTFRRDEQYKETGKTTKDGQQIWQYSDKDEYYLDDGTRVTADGGKYEGSQKKSRIIGKYVTLTRGTKSETPAIIRRDVTSDDKSVAGTGRGETGSRRTAVDAAGSGASGGRPETSKAAPEPADSPEKFNERIQKELVQVQGVADKFTGKIEETSPDFIRKEAKRKFEIDKTAGKPKDVGAGIVVEQFPISLDSKSTKYVVEIRYSKSDRLDKTQPIKFSIKVPGTASEYKAFSEWSENGIERLLGKILDENPNTSNIEKKADAIKHLKEEGMEIADSDKLETFNLQEFSALKAANLEYKKIILRSKEVFTAIEDLWLLGEKLKEALIGSKISKLKLTLPPNAKTPITWDKEKGFGAESEIIGTLLRIGEEKMKAKEITKDEYERFKELSKTKDIEVQGAREDASKRAKHRESYENLSAKLAERQPSSDPRISGLSESKIVENWHHFGGTRTKAEYLMRQGPFSLTQERIPVAAAKIIKSGGIIKEISFEPIFNLAKEQGFKGVRTAYPEGIPEGALEGSLSFQHAYSALVNKENRTENEEKRLQHMTDEVLVPCLELKEAMSKLIFEPEKVGERQSKEIEPELTAPQREVLNALTSLFNFQDRKGSGWEKFLASFSRDYNTGKITMANIDGTTFSVDQGTLDRHFSVGAALTILTNRPGLYDIVQDEKGNYRKFYKPAAVTTEINRLTKLGLLQIVMQEQVSGSKSKGKPSIAEVLSSPAFTERLAKFQISDVNDVQSKFGDEQKKAFQLGFILDQESRFSGQLEEGKEALSDSPAIRAVVEKLMKQSEGQISFKQGREIAQQMMLMGGAEIDRGTGKFKGAGLGVPIKLSDGSTLTLGLAANTERQATFGAALTVRLVKTNGFQLSMTFGVGLAGAAAGLGSTIEAGKIDIGLFAGVAWSWANVIPTVGGSVDLSWNMKKEYQDKLAEARGGNLEKLWGEWKSLGSIEEKYKALQKFPAIKQVVDAYQSNFGLKNEDIVHMIEGVYEQINAKVLDKLDSPIPLIASVGFAMVGPVPVPYISIKIGSAVVYTPHRKEIVRMLPEMSDAVVTEKIEKALKDLEGGKGQVRFIEQTSRLVYSRDGKLMSLEKEDKVDFSRLNTSLESYNEALKEAEIALIQRAPGKIELLVNNTERKDVEIHTDPLLGDLKVVRDNGKIFLVGNITDNLIITRERFSLPFETAEKSASMRDYVTIRKKASVQGKRDRSWMEKHEANFLRKLMEERTFYVERGANEDTEKGIVEVAGFATTENAKLSDEDRKAIKMYMDQQSDFTGTWDKTAIESAAKDIDRCNKALSRMKEKEYDKPKTDAVFFENLGKLYGDKKFKSALGKTIGDGESIIALLQDQEFKPLLAKSGLEKLFDSGNEKLLNTAVIYLENAWFSKFYKDSTNEKKYQRKTL